MNKVITVFKKIRLRQILMTFLAGVLLFVSTACNNAGNTGVQARRQDVPAGLQSTGGTQGQHNPRPEVPGGTATSPNRDVINRFQGNTMNEFSDVDPRAGGAAKAAADKAAALRENAERNVIDETGNIGENTRRILDKKGENVEDVGRNLRESTSETTERAKGTADNLSRSTSRAAQDVTENTRGAAKDVSRSASRAAENVKENTKQASRNVLDRAERAANTTPEYVQGKANQAADNTTGLVEDAMNRVVRGTERAIDRATNTVTDTVD